MKLLINDKPIDYSNKALLKQLIDEGLAKEDIDIVMRESDNGDYFLQIFHEDKKFLLQYLGAEYELSYSAFMLDADEIMRMINSYISGDRSWQSMVDWKKKKRRIPEDSNAFYAKMTDIQILLLWIASLVPLSLGFLYIVKHPNHSINMNVIDNFIWPILFLIGACGSYVLWLHDRYIGRKNNLSWYENIGEVKSLVLAIALSVMAFIPIFVAFLK